MDAYVNKISGVYVAEPQNAAQIRRDCRNFFESLKLSNDEVQSLLMATGEMVVNVIEHAYHDAKGTIIVCCCYVNDIITVIIEDFGDWLYKDGLTIDETRGRGIIIARALTDTFRMTHKSEGGTKVEIQLKTST